MFSINIKKGFRSCCTFAEGKQSIGSHFLPCISRQGTEKYSCHYCGTQSQEGRVMGLLLQNTSLAHQNHHQEEIEKCLSLCVKGEKKHKPECNSNLSQIVTLTSNAYSLHNLEVSVVLDDAVFLQTFKIYDGRDRNLSS